MNSFDPPPFRPHRLLRGGHLQTLASIGKTVELNLPTVRHEVEVSDGDSVVLHDDQPKAWRSGEPTLMLVHGLTGCHSAPYMLRLARRFFDRGIRVFRMDMRGCGAGIDAASQLTHAGRSADIVAALDAVANETNEGPLWATGISLSANQLLRASGRIGEGRDDRPDWFDRLERIAAVAPPLDLIRCSKNMNRFSRRPYNRYFIHWLLQRVPSQVRLRADFQQAMSGPKPKTLWQLDDRFTAPLSGFKDASHYYTESSAKSAVRHNRVPTLVLASQDDPLVPIPCFTADPGIWPATTQLMITKTGGHVGFIDRRGSSWMDEVLASWFTP